MKLKIFFLLALLITALFAYPVGYYVLDGTQKIIDDKRIKSEKINIYVINLDSSKARYEYVQPAVKELGFETQRVSAVNGRMLPDAEVSKLIDPRIFDFYRTTKGTIGCSLSHIKVWKQFLDSDAEFAVIFEDDVFFDPTKLRAVIGELTQNKSYWDIVNFDINHGGAPLTIKTLKHKHLLSVYLTEVAHSGSYMLSRKAALKLLEKALPIKMPVDHYFTRSWEFGLVFAGVENPRLVRQQYGDSDIKARELITPNNASLMFFIKKSIYKVQSGVIRFLYNISVFADLLIKDKE